MVNKDSQLEGKRKMYILIFHFNMTKQSLSIVIGKT